MRALSNIFEEKYFGNPWPYQKLDATPAAIHAKIFERLNNASGIFLQPGFMKDAVVIMDDENAARYYEDIRSDYIDQEYKQYPHYYIIGLEYGLAMMTNPFSVERDPDPFKGNESSYLHPISRRYKHGVLVSEHHVNDDLENEWYLPEYVDPAMSYFNAELMPNQEVETAQG